VRQNKIAKKGDHKRINSLGKKAVNPGLKATAESELRAEHFVLGEKEKERSDGNAQSGECGGVAIGARVESSGLQVILRLSCTRIGKRAYAKCEQEKSRTSQLTRSLAGAFVGVLRASSSDALRMTTCGGAQDAPFA